MSKDVIEEEKENKEEKEKEEELTTPMAEENHKINSSIVWEKAFQDIYLETYGFDIGFTQSKEKFTQELLNNGSHESPTDLFKFLDMLTTRLQKIHVIKRVCCFLGLHNEMDKIIEHEMCLIYQHPGVFKEPKTRSVVIAGETRNEKEIRK